MPRRPARLTAIATCPTPAAAACSVMMPSAQCRWLRRMPGIALATLTLLAGCQRAPPPQTIPLPALDAGRGRIEWRGVLPCADCDGIQTSLQLQRSGERRGFRMIEVFVLGDSGARFVDSGGWTRDGDLIRTVGSDGSLRVFGLLAGGRLQPRDARGKPFPLHDDAVLTPVGPGGAP